LSWCPSFSEKDIETAAEMAFESLHVPAIYLGQVPVLSLYGNGHTTGISFHSGERLTHVCAIYEGYALPDSLYMSNRAGSSVTRKLARLLLDKKDKKIDLKALSESTWEALRINKNRLLKTSANKDSISQYQSTDLNDDRTVLLPDGMLVKLAEEDRDLCGEQLFNDEKLSSKTHDSYDSSMQSLVINCITSTDANFHKSLWDNIILSGGNTKLNGFRQRLHNELLPFSNNNKIDIKQKKNSDISIWLGGSVIASNENFNNHWITQAMYHELGSDIISKHCQLIRNVKK
jgi:actin-related protein